MGNNQHQIEISCSTLDCHGKKQAEPSSKASMPSTVDTSSNFSNETTRELLPSPYLSIPSDRLPSRRRISRSSCLQTEDTEW